MVNGKGDLLRLVLIMLVLLLVPLQPVSAAGWQWIPPQRTLSLMKEGSGLWLVDVRSESAFAEGHIEGAVHIPAGLLATKRLPPGKIIVLVDDTLGLRQGRAAADLLLKKGHDKVYLLEGGLLAWQGEKYPLAGKGSGRIFRSVMPDEIVWARDNRIPVRIFDLRDRAERAQGPVAQAQNVEGETLAERLEKVKEMVAGSERNGLAAQLEKPVTTILVFPVASDPRSSLERYFRQAGGDVRFLEGGYAAWAAQPEKHISTVGACPSCPGGASGEKK